MESIGILQAVTFAIALVGAVLGILNTWRNFDRDKIKIRVNPTNLLTLATTYSGEEIENRGICVEVINLSTFPITIIEIGFANFYPFTNKIRGSKSIPLKWQNLGSYSLPQRLESRESTSYFIFEEVLENHQNLKSIKYAYAKTACGHFFKGTSKLFTEIIQRLCSNTN